MQSHRLSEEMGIATKQKRDGGPMKLPHPVQMGRVSIAGDVDRIWLPFENACAELRISQSQKMVRAGPSRDVWDKFILIFIRKLDIPCHVTCQPGIVLRALPSVPGKE